MRLRGRYVDNLMFNTGVIVNEQDMTEKEVDMAEKDVSTVDPVTTAGEVVTTANVVVSTVEVTTNSTTTTTVDELTLAQTLIEIKAAKPKVVTTTATTTITAVTRPTARGVIVQEPSEFTTTTSPSQPLQLPQAKDKGKVKIVKPKKPLKKKDQIMFDKEVAQKLQAQLDAKLEEEEKLARKREEDANIAEWDDGNTELVKCSETRTEGSSKRAGEELEYENLKKQKLDENVEAEVDDDQEEAKMKKHIEIVPDDEVAIDAIPLATKAPIIVDWKIIKDGKMGYFQIIRAYGSLKRPEEGYERVLWGDLKVMFEPDVESEVWRNLQGHKVTVWKLFSSSGVHFVRFQNLHIFMLVEKKYPLTPATIIEMLNKKL
ncbi:hypothetical protein Tco_1117936 [Tanacetum coccineum]